MEKNKYFLEDHEEKVLSTREELQELLEYRDKNDIRVFPNVNECACVGIDVNTNKEMASDVAKMEVETNIFNTGLNSDTKLLLVFPKDFVPVIYPVRYTAMMDIEGRAGLYGRTIECTEAKSNSNIQVLPALLRGQFLSTGMSLNGNSSCILIRDGKVSAMKSHKYQVLTEMEMIEVLENHMKNDFPDFQYRTGAVSHAFLSCEYLFNATDMEESLKFRLEELGKNISSLRAGLIFTTSDVGTSSVAASPFIIIDGLRVRFGNRVSVRHDCGNSPEDFAEVLKGVAVSLTEAEDRIEELGNTEIKNPYDCFMNIVDKYDFPKRDAKTIASQLEVNFPSGCDAIDIYISLNEFVEAKSNANASVENLLKMQESIGRLLYIDYTEYDKEYTK